MRKTFIKKNMLSYEDLMNLSNEKCVKVNRTYFYNLIAKSTLLEIDNKDCYIILNKYLEIDRMLDFIEGRNTISPYFLMSAADIKYLLTIIKDIPTTKIAFMKSEVSVEKLNHDHNKIKEQFLSKQQEKEIEINFDEENIEEIRKAIKEDKIVEKQGREWRMVESPGCPCEVKISKKSRKILVKSLIK